MYAGAADVARCLAAVSLRLDQPRDYNDGVGGELSDTDPEAQRVHWDLLRRATPAQRLALALSLSRTVIALSRDGIARRAPASDPQTIGLHFVALHYGEELTEALRRDLEARRR